MKKEKNKYTKKPWVKVSQIFCKPLIYTTKKHGDSEKDKFNDIHKRYIIILKMVRVKKQGETLESNKRKMPYPLQGPHNKINS